MSDRMAVVILVVATALVRVIEPGADSMYPPCPFRWLTGLECAGCGSLRALRALSDGDLASAWVLNPLFVLFVVGFLAVALARAADINGRLVPTWSYRAIPAAVAIFWIARTVF